MNIGNHGGSCGHSCCLRVADLSVPIGNDKILEKLEKLLVSKRLLLV